MLHSYLSKFITIFIFSYGYFSIVYEKCHQLLSVVFFSKATHVPTLYPLYRFSFNSVPPQSLILLLSYSLSTRSNTLQNRVCSLNPTSFSQNNPSKGNYRPVQGLLVLFTFSLTLLFLRLFSNALLPNFILRWRNLVAFAEQNEPKTRAYSPYLWQAIVSYEEKRFFSQFGVDPVGISRAVWSLSARGGGSTITQQFIFWCRLLGIAALFTF